MTVATAEVAGGVVDELQSGKNLFEPRQELLKRFLPFLVTVSANQQHLMFKASLTKQNHTLTFAFGDSLYHPKIDMTLKVF